MKYLIPLFVLLAVAVGMGARQGNGHAAQPYVFGRAEIAAGNTPYAVASADFNGDGSLDVAVVNLSDSLVSIYFGQPDGTLSKRADYRVGTSPDAITVGDFNGDGKPDLAVANENCANTCGLGSISVLLNCGDGTFQPAVAYGTNTDPVSIVAADFNGDGRSDLAVANAISPVSPGPGTVTVFFNKGDGTFSRSGEYSAGSGIGQLSAVRLPGTSYSSLAVTNFTALNGVNAVSILRNLGNGTFALPVPYATGKAPASVVSLDFNHDGIADLAITNANDSTVSILLGKSDGSFIPRVDYPVAPGPHRVIAQDINADQVADLVVSAASSLTYGGAISILLGNGDGTFQPAVSYGTGNNPWALVAGDFNHDGKLDVLFTNGDTSRLSVLLGNGDGTFPTCTSYSNVGEVDAITVADFNGDGLQDLALINRSNSRVTIVYGGLNGTFTGKRVYVIGLSPSAIAAADLSGNGRVDLVVADAGDSSISVLINSGGSFGPINTYPVGSHPGGVAIADFNGDGKLDLAVTNTNDDTVSILVNRGDGTFSNAVAYVTGSGPTSIVAADFNGDGKPDLAIADFLTPNNSKGPGLVSILINNGDGTFANRVDYLTGQHPTAVVAGGFNAEGKIDLAVAANTDIFGNVSILNGQGDGTFLPGTSYNEGFGISSMVAADFNSDGIPDLAVISAINNTVFILKGSVNGTFQVQGTYGVDNGALSIAAGSFLNNSILGRGFDLVVGNSGLSVFLNRVPY